MTYGSRYYTNKERFTELIRSGSISAIEGIAEKHGCYFCLNRIKGKMRTLNEIQIIEGEPVAINCFLHEKCYQETKIQSDSNLEALMNFSLNLYN